MKIKKKIITIIMILIIMLTFKSTVCAVQEGEEVQLYSKGICGSMLVYGNNITAEVQYVVYNKGGIEYPAYCVQKEYEGVTENRPYSVTISEGNPNILVWRALINGYPYKTPEELGCLNANEAYTATKHAVYCMIYGRQVEEYDYRGEAGKRAYYAMKTIVNAARNSTETPKDSNITINSTSNWSIDVIDNKYLSKTFTLSASAEVINYNIYLSGKLPEGMKITDLQNNDIGNQFTDGEFKILMPIESITSDGSFNIKVSAKLKTIPMYYGVAPVPEWQDYVLTANVVQNSSKSITEKYEKNKTKIIVEKRDENGNKLQGVKFNLLNENKEIIKENLVTDEMGIIKIENLLSGTYYLQETETLEQYELNEEITKIELSFNEEKTVTITNIQTPEKPEEPTPEEPVLPKLPRTGW